MRFFILSVLVIIAVSSVDAEWLVCRKSSGDFTADSNEKTNKTCSAVKGEIVEPNWIRPNLYCENGSDEEKRNEFKRECEKIDNGNYKCKRSSHFIPNPDC